MNLRVTASLALVSIFTVSIAVGMDRLTQIPAIQQLNYGQFIEAEQIIARGEPIPDNFKREFNAQNTTVNYQDVDGLLCPMYALHFAWQLSQNYTKSADVLSRALNDRDLLHGLFKWFKFFAPDHQRATPSELADIDGDTLHRRAEDFLISKGNNGINCFNRLIIHGSAASAGSAEEIELAFATDRIPYVIYIINTTEAVRPNSGHGEPEVRGSHWVTLLVHKTDNGPEFIAANSMAGDVSRYQPVRAIIERLSRNLALIDQPAIQEAPHQVQQEDDASRALRESRELYEQQQQHKYNATIEESKRVYLAQEKEKTAKKLTQNNTIRGYIEKGQEENLRAYIFELEKELGPEEIDDLMFLIGRMRESVANNLVRETQRKELEEAMKIDTANKAQKTPPQGSNGARTRLHQAFNASVALGNVALETKTFEVAFIDDEPMFTKEKTAKAKILLFFDDTCGIAPSLLKSLNAPNKGQTITIQIDCNDQGVATKALIEAHPFNKKQLKVEVK